MAFNTSSSRPPPAYLRIADGIREQIASGVYSAGAKLPSMDEMVTRWNASYCTVNNAMMVLVKAGWIERRHGAGTYAIDPGSRFLCAAIYHSADITSYEQSAFVRNLHFSLVTHLDAKGKTTMSFFDSRPESRQHEILPALREALAARQVQALIVPSVHKSNCRWLAQLPLPSAFLSNSESPSQFGYDNDSLPREALRLLKAQNCRSVGMITNRGQHGIGHHDAIFFKAFREAAAETGLETRDAWIRNPNGLIDQERYGYEQFFELWKQAERPDSVLVYPDQVARGVILAALEIGRDRVCQEMKFVLHRNAHLPMVCPLPAIVAVSDEDAIARGLIEQVEEQFRGNKVSPKLIPFVFERNLMS